MSEQTFFEIRERELDAAARNVLVDDLTWARSTGWGQSEELRKQAEAEVAAMPIEKVYQILQAFADAWEDPEDDF